MKDKIIVLLRKPYLDSCFAILSFLIGVFSVFFNLIKVSTVGSLLFKSSFAIILLWFVLNLFSKYLLKTHELHSYSIKKVLFSVYKTKQFKSLFVFVLISIISIVSIFISSKFRINSISFFNQFICVISCLALFYLVLYSNINDVSLNIILLANLILSYVVVILFVVGITRTWHNTTSWVDLNLNFQNPNPAGEFCFIVLMFLVGTIFYHRSFIIKTLSACCAPIMFFLMNLTSSRNPFIALGLAGIMLILVLLSKRNRKAIVTLSIVVPIVYIFLIMFFGIMGDYSDSLKALLEKYEIYGRYYLWAEYFKEYSSHLFFGSYYLVGETGVIASFVNSYIMFLIVFGPVSFSLFLIFQYLVLTDISSKIEGQYISPTNIFPILCYLAILYLGLNEGGVFVGAGGLHIIGVYCAVIFNRFVIREKQIVGLPQYYSVDI